MARRQTGWTGVDLKRGEIWLVGLDPVLIVSPEPFNRVAGVPVVLPITGGGRFARTTGFTVSLAGAGSATTGVIRCDRPRALDLRARGGRKLEAIPSEIMDEVIARLATIFD